MLGIVAKDADPGDMTAVLCLAAPRLTVMLFFGNVVPEDRHVISSFARFKMTPTKLSSKIVNLLCICHFC
jgi:hypothetical protein